MANWHWIKEAGYGNWQMAYEVGSQWFLAEGDELHVEPLEIGPRIPSPDEGRLVVLPDDAEELLVALLRIVQSLGQQEAGDG